MMVSRCVILVAAVVIGRTLDPCLIVTIAGVTVPGLALPNIRLLPSTATQIARLNPKYLNQRQR